RDLDGDLVEGSVRATRNNPACPRALNLHRWRRGLWRGWRTIPVRAARADEVEAGRQNVRDDDGRVGYRSALPDVLDVDMVRAGLIDDEVCAHVRLGDRQNGWRWRVDRHLGRRAVVTSVHVFGIRDCDAVRERALISRRRPQDERRQRSATAIDHVVIGAGDLARACIVGSTGPAWIAGRSRPDGVGEVGRHRVGDADDSAGWPTPLVCNDDLEVAGLPDGKRTERSLADNQIGALDG